MAIQLPTVNVAASDTFQTMIDKLNGVINTVANSVVTANTSANGAATTGNAFVVGILGGTVLVANTLRGGNVQSSANLTITSNTITIGANTILADSGLKLGNTTINAVINSTGVSISGNSQLTGAGLSIGNNTVNAVINSTGVSISGIPLPLGNNKATVAVGGTLVGSASRINFSGSGSANVAATVDAGNGQINVVVSATSALGVSGGTNTMVLFNDSGLIGGNAGFTYTKSTNNVSIANTLTIGTAVVNSTSYFAGNSIAN